MTRSGPDVVQLRAEPRAEAAEAGDDLVRAEEDAVVVAELPDALPVPGRGSKGAARVLNRLHHHHRDRVGPRLLDRLLEVVEQEAR